LIGNASRQYGSHIGTDLVVSPWQYLATNYFYADAVACENTLRDEIKLVAQSEKHKRNKKITRITIDTITR
jgi:hypothetical protein